MPSSKTGFDVYLKWLGTLLSSFPGTVSLLRNRDKITAVPREEASCTQTMTTSFSHFKGLTDYADGHQRVLGWELTGTPFEITGNITQQPYLKAVDLEPSEV